MNPIPKTAIIGAGPSGLAACKVLRDHDIPVTCYEAGDRVGGQWVLDNTSGTSACYRSVVSNTHRGIIHFSDFGPDSSEPDFLDHTQLAAYFASYAKHFSLLESIEFETRVTRVRRTANDRWTIETNRGTGGTFDAVVVAPGRFGKPVLPKIRGEFPGTG